MNWMLTDMDSFFASVERHLRPELRGRPLGIIPVESDYTSIIAASHDAKRFGVKTGTGVREARRLCPGIRLVKARPDVYVGVHRGILRSIDRCVEVDRVYSIDEWTVRLRNEERRPDAACALGREIKGRLLADFGPWMTCSIGIAPTRLLAKIASKLEKPDGLTILPVEDMPRRIEHLPLGDLHGIARGMLDRLHGHGIHDIRGLWEVSRWQAIRIWGSVAGAYWWAGFHGHDEPEPPTTRRSMSHGNVLDPRFRDEDGAFCIMARLVCKLSERLRRGGYLAKTLRISVEDDRGAAFSADIGLPSANDTTTILKCFYVLWRRRVPGPRPIRKVGVCVAGLVPASEVPLSLFDEFERSRRLSEAIDAINRRLGPLTVYFGPLHGCRHLMEDKIAFGRIPGGSDS